MLGIRSTAGASGAVLCPLNGGHEDDCRTSDHDLADRDSSKLSDAARVAKAAEAGALTGSIDEGVIVSMDIEQLIYEAGRLHDAASLLKRLSQE